jgi:hypothetical protein
MPLVEGGSGEKYATFTPLAAFRSRRAERGSAEG